MAADNNKAAELSKAEYLKRYLSVDDNSKNSKGKIKKKRRKVPEKRLKIVDDDIDWRQMVEEQAPVEDDDEEAPVIAEIIDDRPEEVKRMETFRVGNRWKVIGADEENDKNEEEDAGDAGPGASPMDSQDMSPPRRARHDSADLSPSGQHSGEAKSKDLSLPKKKSKSSQHSNSSSLKSGQNRHDSDSDQSPPRKKPIKMEASDSDQSPPRRRSKTKPGSDSDQSPPRRRRHVCTDSDEDLSPPRRPGRSQDKKMLSGGRAGLVSAEVLREEQEENRRREKKNRPLEDASRNAETVFRDKSGKRRDLDSEREEKNKKAGEEAAKVEKYAQWGKGLAQNQMQQQKLEDAVHEAQKPLARHKDDEELDRMLREQEREGDPMAAMLRRKKEGNTKTQDKPRYRGPPPPLNRFNIQPGYRWDGVDRSNGFEQKRYMRIAEKKAVQEMAYKWSVEDM